METKRIIAELVNGFHQLSKTKGLVLDGERAILVGSPEWDIYEQVCEQPEIRLRDWR